MKIPQQVLDYIRHPHKYSLKAKFEGHLWSFNVKWFEKALQSRGIMSYRIRTTFYIIFPYEIIVEVKKVY